MKKMMKTLVAAGLVAGTLIGASAALDGAQAVPVARMSSPIGDASMTTVQYGPYGYRRPYRRYYRGMAGVYRCGPYALKTRLQRKACR